MTALELLIRHFKPWFIPPDGGIDSVTIWENLSRNSLNTDSFIQTETLIYTEWLSKVKHDLTKLYIRNKATVNNQTRPN